MLASNFEKIFNINKNNENDDRARHDIKLLPGWHDVIQLDETRVGKPFARWAIVAFIDGHGVEALPRTETHRWYSESWAE